MRRLAVVPQWLQHSRSRRRGGNGELVLAIVNLVDELFVLCCRLSSECVWLQIWSECVLSQPNAVEHVASPTTTLYKCLCVHTWGRRSLSVGPSSPPAVLKSSSRMRAYWICGKSGVGVGLIRLAFVGLSGMMSYDSLEFEAGEYGLSNLLSAGHEHRVALARVVSGKTFGDELAEDIVLHGFFGGLRGAHFQRRTCKVARQSAVVPGLDVQGDLLLEQTCVSGVTCERAIRCSCNEITSVRHTKRMLYLRWSPIMIALLMQGMIFFKYASIGTEVAMVRVSVSSTKHGISVLVVSKHTWGDVLPTLADNELFDATSDVHPPLVIHVAQVATAKASAASNRAMPKIDDRVR